MDWISLSALQGAANNANAGGGGGPSPGPSPSPSPGVAERTDEHYANTTLLLHGDGNPGANNVNNPSPEAQYMALSDDSPDDRPVGVFGSNVFGTDFNPFYYNNGSFSNSFDGTAEGKVTISPTDDRTDLSGPSDFTIQFWVFPQEVGQGSYTEIFSRGKNAYSGYRAGIKASTTNIYFSTNYAGAGATVYTESSTQIPLFEWTHVAITREASTIKIYLNGVLDATNTGFTGNPSMASDDTVYLGRGSYDTSGRQFKGLLNSFELIKGRNLYSANFTPPIAPTEDHTVHGELSVSSDASGDYLQLTDTDFSKFDFSTGPFTMEFWIYYDTLGTTILGQTGWGNVVQIRSNKFEFYQADAAGNSGAYWITGTVNVVVGRWYHVVFQRNDAGVLDLFVNGTREATNSTYASTAMKFHSAKGDICFRYWNGGASAAVDQISNFRIQKGAVYATGASITVPTAPFTRDANTVLLTCQGKTFQDSSNNNFLISRHGDAHISEFNPYGDGYWSANFDGTDDYLTVPNSTDTNLGGLSEDYTLECWFRLTTITSAHRVLFGMSNGGGSVPKWLIGINQNSSAAYAANKVGVYSNGGTSGDGDYAPGFVAGQWYHFRLVYDYDASYPYLKIYINGTLVVNNGGNVVSSSGAFTIGTDGEFNGDFIGQISNVRLLKGTALGTDVPTAPLTAITNTKLLACQSNRFVDNSSSPKTITVGNNTSISELIPFEYLKRQSKLLTCQENRFKDVIDYRWRDLLPGSSAKVSTASPFFSNTSYRTANTGSFFKDGSSFATIDSQAQNFKYGLEDYTIEFWVYPNESGTTQATLIGRNGTGNLAIPYIYRAATNRVVSLYYSSAVVSTTKALLPFEWTHIAVCRENGTSRIFMNGELQGSAADTTNIIDAVKFVIGNNGGGSASGPLFGYFHGVRVEKGRAKYSSNTSFNPVATAPVLANGANTGVISTNQFSNFFDGNDHLANTSAISINDYSFTDLNDFTIEMWFNPTDLPGSDMLLYDARVANGAYPAIILNSANKILWYVNTGARITSRALSVSKWYHLAIVRSGGSTTMYLDGLREGDVYADTVDYSHGDINISLNQPAGGEQFRGSIHGLNIINGVAKYTSNTATTYSPVSKIGTTSTNGSFSRFIQAKNLKIAIPTTGLPMGTQHRTIEFWAKITAYNSDFAYMVSYGVNSSGQVYSIGLTASGTLRVVGYGTDYDTGYTVPLKTWFHISVNYDGTNNTIFYNGMRIDKRSHSISTGAHTNLYVNADAAGGAGTYAFPSGIQICDLAVYNVAIRSTVLDSGFILPTTATTIASNNNIVLLGCQSNTDIELANNVLSGGYDQSALSSETPFDNGYWSVHFDGDDYLTVPTTTDHDFGTGDFTVEFWIQPKEALGFHIFLSAPQNTSTQIGYDTGNGPRYLYFYNGANVITGTGAGSLVKDVWNHVALAREGSTLSLFSNGNRVGTATHSSSVSLSGLNIGRYHAGGYDMISSISNLRIVKGSALYDPSSATYTVPTSPLTTTSQGASASEVQLLTCQSGALIDNSTANSNLGYTITPSGDAKVSRSRPFSNELGRDQVLLACQDKEVIKDNSHLDTKLTRTGDVTRSAHNPFDNGFWSADFDGTSDSFTLESTAALQLPDEFTIEFFMKLDTVVVDTQHPSPITFPSNGSYVTQVYVQATNGYVGLYYNGDIVKSADGSIVANKWYHVAVGRDSSDQIALWLDGVRVSTATNGFSVGNSSGTFRVGSYSGTGGDVNGKISNLRIVKGTDVYGYSNATITVPTSPLTKISGTSLLTCQSSNFQDNSDTLYRIVESGANTRPVFPDTFANTIPQQTTLLTGRYSGSIRSRGFINEAGSYANTVNPVGDVTQGSFTPHYPPSGYWSNFFDGDGDYITFTQTADFSLDGDFTIEAWIYAQKNDADTQWRTIFFDGQTSSTQIALQSDDSGKLTFYDTSHIIKSTAAIPLHEWVHFAVVRDGSGSNNMSLYINGVRDAQATSTATFGHASGTAYIGSYSASGGNFAGYISNFRWIKGSALYSGASITLATTPFTKTSQSATASEVKLLTCQSNRFVDNSDDDIALTSVNTKCKGFFPFDLTTSYDAYEHGGSAYFDGSGDYIYTEGDSLNNLSVPTSNEFSLEFWFHRLDSGNIDVIVSAHALDEFQFAINGSSQFDIYMFGSRLSSTPTFPLSSNPSYHNCWNHFVITRESHDNKIRTFINGELVTITAAITTDITFDDFVIGHQGKGTNHPSNGYVSSLRYSNNDVPTEYHTTQTSVGTQVFTPPTAPVRAVANTSLMFNFVNAGVYDSTAKNVITLVGDARISTGAANTKFGTGSISYDGTGDYFTIPQNDNLIMGTGDFTFELFLKYYLPTYGTFYLFDQRNTASQAAIAVFYESSTTSLDFYVSGASRIQADLATNPREWQHVALVRHNGSTKIYVNGRQSGATYSDTNDYLAPALTYFGARFSVEYLINGAMDEIRVTKGFARYTANFTPMTAASGNKTS